MHWNFLNTLKREERKCPVALGLSTKKKNLNLPYKRARMQSKLKVGRGLIPLSSLQSDSCLQALGMQRQSCF